MITINGKRKGSMENDGWMAETAFSTIKRMFVGEYTAAIRFKHGKRDDNGYHCTTCLEELHKMNGNN